MDSKDWDWPAGVKSVATQEAIQILDRTEKERDFADGMVGALEMGWLIAGIDEGGTLQFHLTPEGEQHVKDMIGRP